MNSRERWLCIVGIGEDGWDGLNNKAKHAIEHAELLYGGERHLAFIPAGLPEQLAFLGHPQWHRRCSKSLRSVDDTGESRCSPVATLCSTELECR